jgi:hypothetical protein
MKTHVLKTHPEYFQAIVDGTKTFECRKNDRDFKVGEILQLTEYDPKNDQYSGRTQFVRVTYILDNPFYGVQPGYIVMAIH